MDPIQVRTYRDATADAAARRFQADAAVAAKSGYYPASQVWEGSSLTVTYERREMDATTPAPPQVVEPSTRGLYIPAVAVGIGGILSRSGP